MPLQQLHEGNIIPTCHPRQRHDLAREFSDIQGNVSKRSGIRMIRHVVNMIIRGTRPGSSRDHENTHLPDPFAPLAPVKVAGEGGWRT